MSDYTDCLVILIIAVLYKVVFVFGRGVFMRAYLYVNISVWKFSEDGCFVRVGGDY